MQRFAYRTVELTVRGQIKPVYRFEGSCNADCQLAHDREQGMPNRVSELDQRNPNCVSSKWPGSR
jgi:hypothetical protein